MVPQDVVWYSEGVAIHEKADHAAAIGKIAALIEVGGVRRGQVRISQGRYSVAPHAGVDERVLAIAAGHCARAVESVFVPRLADRRAPQAAITGEKSGEAYQRAQDERPPGDKLER